MLVLDDRRLVIVTPPHTASRNVTRALLASLAGREPAYAVHGPVPDSPAIHDHHYCRLSAGQVELGYRVACVVRHPLDRLVGLYWHWVRTIGPLYPRDPLMAFDAFVQAAIQAAIAGDAERLSWFYCWSIARLLLHHGHNPAAVEPLRFEHLQTDLQALGLNVQLEARYPDSHRDWRPWYTPSLLAAVEPWARDDLRWYADPEPRTLNPEPAARVSAETHGSQASQTAPRSV